MSELGVVKNLFECLSGTTPYVLNEAVVIAHDANLRAGEVDAAFGAVGIEKICDRACRADAMVDWYCAAQGLDTVPQDGVKRTVIEERLKDIVERRNQVAHRGGNPVDLLGSAAMSDAVAFIESFSRSIFGLVVGRYLEAHHNASANRIELALRAGTGPSRTGRSLLSTSLPRGSSSGSRCLSSLNPLVPAGAASRACGSTMPMWRRWNRVQTLPRASVLDWTSSIRRTPM
ncbi:HEPN domain-containing protein [Cystobacter fuscus]